MTMNWNVKMKKCSEEEEIRDKKTSVKFTIPVEDPLVVGNTAQTYTL
jgi:hypothetical protein